jgi:cytochrome c
MTRRDIVLTGVLGLGASLLMGQVHPFGNPWKVGPQSAASLLQDGSVPADARAVLVQKCADCHSEASHAPVYASLAPGSWLIERDIMQGRAHLNLSHWQQLPPERREVLEQEIVQQTSKGKMPPVQYRLLHWNARLLPQDVHALAALQTGQEGAGASVHEAGDAARGKMVFEKRCVGCHAMDANREGPQLRGVYGRKAGSLAGFQYSASVKNSGLTWNPETLDKWLTDPDALVPGNDMSFATPKAQDRADLIAYFEQEAQKK